MNEPFHNIIFLCLGLILCVSLLTVLAQKIKIAYPIFLVLAGLLISVIPGVPKIHLEPELIFTVILPPVLFNAAHEISLKSLWRWRRMISFMALGYVLATATAVAFISHWLIPGFTLSQGFLLGAIISPPDAAAAMSVLKFTNLSKNIVAILEGESLLNDATSLTLFRFALAAITTHHFVWHEAVINFGVVVVSGIAIGLVFGLLFYAIYKWLPTNANVDIAFSIALPYLMYLTAEELNSSGVLAVVSGGLFVAYQTHFVFSHQSRLKAAALWTSLVFILNAVVFFLIGLQLPEIIKSVQGTGVGKAALYALTISLLVIIVRLISGMASSVFTHYISRYITVVSKNSGWRLPFVGSWIGMRGVVSLASASAIPLLLPNGQAFPGRNLILFITFVVILVTLIGQGLSLSWVIRLLNPHFIEEIRSDQQQLLEIELELSRVADQELNINHQQDTSKNELLKYRGDYLKSRVSLLKEANSNDGTRKHALERMEHFREIMNKVTDRERSMLHTFRKKADYDDDVIAFVERRLDLEEEQLQRDDE